MTQTQHTPGPWDGIQLAGEGLDKPFVYKIGIFGAELSMAMAPDRVVTEAELNANAFLIAAAPDMYEALFKNQQLICAAQEILHDYLLPDSRQNEKKTIDKMLELFDGPFQREVQKKNRETLAKARGQS